MAFTLSAPQTIAGIPNSYEVTGSGNLDDLATAFSTVGCTRVGTTLTFNSGGTSRIYAVSGTLLDQRNFNFNIDILGKAHVCWSYASSASVTLGKFDTSLGIKTGAVHINYMNGALSVGIDPFEIAGDIGKCFSGLGAFRLEAGSVHYNQTSRSDFDLPESKTNVTYFDDVLVSDSSSGVCHSHVTGGIQTTSRTRFQTSSLVHFNGINLPVVLPLSTPLGLRMLNVQTGTVRVLQLVADKLDGYLTGSAVVLDSVDPASLYHNADSYALNGIKRILRTLKATSKSPLGVNIADSKLVVIPLTGGSASSVTTFTSSAGKEVIQSTVAHSVQYATNGTGWTDVSQYQVSVLAFGYPSSPTTYNVKTNSGTAGIAVSAVLSKSTLVTTAYASVATAQFSFSTTGNGTLTISDNATVAQAAEFLFKLAYDNADQAFWRGLSHTPATPTSIGADFGAINIVVSGGTLSGTSAVLGFKTTGTVTTSGTGVVTATYTDANQVGLISAIGSQGNTVELRRMSNNTVIRSRVGDGPILVAPADVGVSVYLARVVGGVLVASSVNAPKTLASGDNGTVSLYAGDQVQVANIDIPTAAQNAVAVRAELATELARVDATVSSRLASASYTAPANADIAAIKTKTDTLVNGPTLAQIEGSAVLAKQSGFTGLATESNVNSKASQASVTALGTPMQAGEVVDANIIKVNDVLIDGVGTQADPFGPV